MNENLIPKAQKFHKQDRHLRMKPCLSKTIKSLISAVYFADFCKRKNLLYLDLAHISAYSATHFEMFPNFFLGSLNFLAKIGRCKSKCGTTIFKFVFYFELIST